MRVKFALKNTLASVLVEIFTAISGIILPRYFISLYGSSINGLVSSIGQFITYMGLVEAGVSAAATVELYKPLADNNYIKINEIISAAKGFYLKSGLLFIILDIILIIGYPYIIRNEIADISFVRIMILVLSLNGMVDYFLLGKYRVLLVADQKTYIIALAQSVGTIVTLFVSVLLITLNCSPILVKGVVAVVYLLRTFYVIIYVKRNYHFINFNSYYSPKVFPQRHSALFHQIVGMICNNTDIVLLTLMLLNNALIEVSVYSAYNMIAANLTSLFNSISKGLSASFGNIIAKEDTESLEKSFNYFEFLYFILLFIVYTCMAVLMFSFISLYTSTFADAESYIRWNLVILFTTCGIVQNIRIPGCTVQIAAGHFKQTQKAAMIEAILNFGISIILVRFIGITGVLLGTIVAYLYRSTYAIIYNARHFLPKSLKRTIFRIFRNLILFGIITALGIFYLIPYIQSWLTWILCATLLFIITTLAFFLLNFILEPQMIRKYVQHIKIIRNN